MKSPYYFQRRKDANFAFIQHCNTCLRRLPADFCIFCQKDRDAIVPRSVFTIVTLRLWENAQIYKHVYVYIHVTYVKYVCSLRFLPISSRRSNAQHTTASRTQPHVYNCTHCGRSATPNSFRVAFIFKNKFDFLIYFLFLLWKFSYNIVKTENIWITTTTQSYNYHKTNKCTNCM